MDHRRVCHPAQPSPEALQRLSLRFAKQVKQRAAVSAPPRDEEGGVNKKLSQTCGPVERAMQLTY